MKTYALLPLIALVFVTAMTLVTGGFLLLFESSILSVGAAFVLAGLLLAVVTDRFFGSCRLVRKEDMESVVDVRLTQSGN